MALKNSGVLKILPEFTTLSTHIYEYNNYIVINNFVWPMTWIYFDKQIYFDERKKYQLQTSDSFVKRYDKFITDINVFNSCKQNLLDELWKELEIDKTKLNNKNISTEGLKIVGKKLKKYGLEKVYEKLALHVAVLVGEYAIHNTPPGFWSIELSHKNDPMLMYNNCHSGKIDIYRYVLRNLRENKINLEVLVEVANL